MPKLLSCIVCRSREYQLIYGNQLRRCQVCGFVTAALDAETVDFSELYSAEYFNGEEYLDYTLDKNIIQRNFRRRLARAFRFAPPNAMKTVLEIGCAYGFFGEVLRELVPKSTYVGYDVASAAVCHATATLKLNALCQDYLESSETPNHFTDCFMWDVIEHLPHPHKVIERVHSDLQLGGRLFITTGDIEQLLPRLQGSSWRMIHPPTHLHYFSRRSLSRLLETHGFEVHDVTYPSIARSVRLIFYSLFILRKFPGRITQLLYRMLPENLSISTNTFDIMFLIATRKY